MAMAIYSRTVRMLAELLIVSISIVGIVQATRRGEAGSEAEQSKPADSTVYDPPIVISETNLDNVETSGLTLRCILKRQDTTMQVQIETLRYDDIAFPTLLQPKSFAVAVIDRNGNETPARLSSLGGMVCEVGRCGVLTGRLEYYVDGPKAGRIRDVSLVRVRFGAREINLTVREGCEPAEIRESDWVTVVAGSQKVSWSEDF